ncbi:MAG: hypothetical protein R2774_07710 [Saprospiraceae bacterium]
MLPTKKQVILFIIIAAAVSSNAQKRLQFSIESGAILPVPIFYKGINTSSNSNIDITSKIGISAIINCKWQYDRNSSLTLAACYESYRVNLKEYVIFPSDITDSGAVARSFLYSNFDANNLGLRLSFGNKLSSEITLNAGFQYGVPLNHHFRYTYYGRLKLKDLEYNYETQNPFSLFANIEYQWYQSKKLNFTLVPEFSYNLQKDAKTYVNENQIRKMYLALRVGVGFR